MIHLGIFAKTFDGNTPEAVLGAAGRAGYAVVQYNMACSGIGSLPANAPADVAKAVRTASARTGVGLAALSATYNMIHPDLEKRTSGRASFTALAAQAHTMGTRLLTVCTGSADPQDQWRHHPDNRSKASWAAMMTEFEHLMAIAERHNLLLGVEPELANVVDGAAAALKLIADAQSDRICIILDPANLVEIETPGNRRRIIAEAVDTLGSRIVMAHAKDRQADGSFAAAGKGVVDFPDFIRSLKSTGFDGPLITHGLTADDAPGVAIYLKSLI